MGVLGIKLRTSSNIHYFESGGFDLKIGESVVVKTDNGTEIGYVIISSEQIIFSEIVEIPEPILRKATEEDMVNSRI